MTETRWERDEEHLHRALTALAEHGAAAAVPPPLRAAARPVRQRPSALRRGAAVAGIAAAVLSVPIGLSGFLPGVPFSGDAVVAQGEPAATSPLCDVLAVDEAPAGDRVVRPARTGPLSVLPAADAPRATGAEVREALVARGVAVEPGSQVRYGVVDGEPTWTLTTCGAGRAVLRLVDPDGTVRATRAAPLSAVAADRYVSLPGARPRALAEASTSDVQVLADDGRTWLALYEAVTGEVCVVSTGPDGAVTDRGCASVDPPEEPAFAVFADWSTRSPVARVAGIAPAGTSWIRVVEAGDEPYDVLLARADRRHGDRSAFAFETTSASVELVAYDAAGEERARHLLELEQEPAR